MLRGSAKPFLEVTGTGCLLPLTPQHSTGLLTFATDLAGGVMCDIQTGKAFSFTYDE